ncbi:hypothetical protein [Nocardioides sp.]|uniref:NACHT domain-containing protein n=1 Tax=Nocardioides sp. TaxID=35761 RepID=UPI00321A01FA
MPDAFPGYRPLPLGQADGGRDGVQTVSGETVVFQVKWSGSGHEKDPVSWLDQVVRREEPNLKRLAREGVRRYVLVTNVGSTGAPKTGTFDRLDRKLQDHAKAYDFEEMTCVWREQLDAFLDTMADEVKWKYADMLAGWDLIRYLIDEHFAGNRDRGLRSLVRKVAATQWSDDERVKFSQSEGVDRERVADLFIDVTAVRLRTVARPTPLVAGRRPRARSTEPAPDRHLGGVAQYLLKSKSVDPFGEVRESATLVRGAPGQGKSTLTQFVSQAHRAAFMPESKRPEDLPRLDRPRFPLRVDLSEYVRWLQGIDVFDQSETDESTKRPRRRQAGESSIECFLADLMTYASGGTKVTADDVHELFERVPSIVVLDGLDEAGSPKMRGQVVDAINKFSWRGQTATDPVQVVVTTRPSTNELPEPDPELFEVIALDELSLEQRDEYLRKWCKVKDIHGREGREMRKSFKQKSAEPYIGELASNPMQLTILLDLIHERGAATPTQRTDLYDSYVELLLAREANKYPKAVRKHQESLKEVIPFLGWYLQSRSEEDSSPGRMATVKLQAAMRHFQFCYGNNQSIVDDLFEAISDRLWALTSKSEGTFEFEVLSLREYFAAQFLYRYAGEDTRGFDRTVVFRELLRRPQWLNTARFYGGNAHGGEVVDLVDGILDELQDEPPPAARISSWTLVTDGVFLTRPRRARELVDALVRDDEGRVVLLNALSRNELRPLPSLPDVQGDDEPDAAWARLTSELAHDPDSPEARRTVRVVRELLNQRSEFAAWWSIQMAAAVGTSDERAWLVRAAEVEAAAGVTLNLDELDLGTPGTAELFLNTGALPAPGGAFEGRLLQAVLDGDCPYVYSVRSMPAQVAAALRPSNFHGHSEIGFADLDGNDTRLRREAISKLRRTSPGIAKVAALRRFKSGQKGSTFPWSATASALYDHAGRCWLASEIAIIGANAPLVFGGVLRPAATAFGPDGHPAELLKQTREHATDVGWWREQLQVVTAPDADDLAPAEWTFALWATASGKTIEALLDDWEKTYADLTERRRRVVYRALGTVAERGLVAKRPVNATASTKDIQALLDRRVPGAPSSEKRSARGRPRQPAPAPPSLAAVAREHKWFKVDAVPSYV